MIVVFGLGMRPRVCMCTTSENGVLCNRQQPGRADEQLFIDQYEFVAMRTLSGRNTLHCEFCDQMMVSTWTVIEISLFEKVVWPRKEKERNGPFALLHLAFFPQRRSDEVDLCEINYLGSSLIDFCISIGKCSWLSLRRAPLFKSRFKAGSSRWKNEVAFSYIIQNQLVMTPGFYFTKVNFVQPPLVFPVGFGHLY